MRRLTVSLVVAAALAAGCGGAEEDAPVPAAATTGPTEAQLAFRERILEEIERGEYTCSLHGRSACARADREGARR